MRGNTLPLYLIYIMHPQDKTSVYIIFILEFNFIDETSLEFNFIYKTPTDNNGKGV